MAEQSVASAVRSGRIYCSMFFLAAGMGIGSWAACLPVLSAQTHLDKAQLGLVLLCFALGAIAMMTNVGRLSAYLSCSALSLLGSLVFGAALVIIPYLPGMGWLALAVFFGGAGFGTLDVSMNTDASLLERRSGRHMMSSFHALFSIGNLAGAFIAGQILSHGGVLAVCLGVTGLGVSILAIFAFLGRQGGDELQFSVAGGAAKGARLEGSQLPYLYFLGGMAFLAFMAEGALIDWSAIYLVGTINTAASTGAFGFAVFASAMAVGRIFGDAVTTRIGRTRLVFLGAVTCATSLAIMLVLEQVAVVFVMLAVCGFGVANIVPAIFAEAGRAGGPAAARAMSIVTTIAYAGLLLGPPFLGFVAQASTLVISLWIVVAAFFVIGIATRFLRAQ